MSSDTDVLTSISTEFAQFVFDNVDHIVCILDRSGTFHGMGIIVCSTIVTESPEEKIRRLTRVVKSKEVAKKASIHLRWYDEMEHKSFGKLPFVSMEKLNSNLHVTTSELSIEILWHAASIFRRAARHGPRPNWNGFMENIFANCAHPEKSTITMLPLIDLNPNVLTCIFSTLLHVIDLAFKMNIPTPSITFDQPLWVKAIEIVQTKKLTIVVRLGGFHCLMSFTGSIGMYMEGSGIEKLLVQVYSGKSVVSHMIIGKALSRELRGLYLVDSAHRMTFFNILKGEKENSEEEPKKEIPMDPVAFEHLANEEIDEMIEIYQELNNNDFLSIEFDSNSVIKSAKEKLSALSFPE